MLLFNVLKNVTQNNIIDLVLTNDPFLIQDVTVD